MLLLGRGGGVTFMAFFIFTFFIHLLHDSYRHRHRVFFSFFSCTSTLCNVFLSLSNFHWLIKQLWSRLKGNEIYMCCLLIFFLERWHWISLNLFWPLSHYKCAHVNLASVLNQYVPLSQVFILCFWQLTNSWK